MLVPDHLFTLLTINLLSDFYPLSWLSVHSLPTNQSPTHDHLHVCHRISTQEQNRKCSPTHLTITFFPIWVWNQHLWVAQSGNLKSVSVFLFFPHKCNSVANLINSALRDANPIQCTCFHDFRTSTIQTQPSLYLFLLFLPLYYHANNFLKIIQLFN